MSAELLTLAALSYAFLLLSVACLWVVHLRSRRRLAKLDRLVRENLWASHVMTWAEYVELPHEFDGCPHYEVGGTGPDRRVVVFIRVFAGLPDPVDPNDDPVRKRMEQQFRDTGGDDAE